MILGGDPPIETETAQATIPPVSDPPALPQPLPQQEPSTIPKGQASPKNRDRLTRTKDFLAALQSAATIAAILGGAGWFVVEGQNRARLRVRHEITHRQLAPDKQLVVVDVYLANVGSVKASIPCVRVWVDQILPQIPDPTLVDPDKNCTVSYAPPFALEPGEEFQIHTEHTLYNNPQIVRVYSYSNPTSPPNFGWGLTTIYNLGDTKPTSVAKTPAQSQASAPSSQFPALSP